MAKTEKDPKKSWSWKFTEAIKGLAIGKGGKSNTSFLKEQKKKKDKMIEDFSK